MYIVFIHCTKKIPFHNMQGFLCGRTRSKENCAKTLTLQPKISQSRAQGGGAKRAANNWQSIKEKARGEAVMYTIPWDWIVTIQFWATLSQALYIVMQGHGLLKTYVKSATTHCPLKCKSTSMKTRGIQVFLFNCFSESSQNGISPSFGGGCMQVQHNNNVISNNQETLVSQIHTNPRAYNWTTNDKQEWHPRFAVITDWCSVSATWTRRHVNLMISTDN